MLFINLDLKEKMNIFYYPAPYIFTHISTNQTVYQILRQSADQYSGCTTSEGGLVVWGIFKIQKKTHFRCRAFLYP